MIFPQDPNRRIHRGDALPEERIAEILRRSHWGTLSTVDADGGPYGVPIGFAWDESDGSLILHTYHSGQKLENINRDSRVCFSIVGGSELVTDKFSANFESLIIFGRMEKVAEGEETIRAAKVFCRKFAPKIVAGMEAEAAEQEIDDLALMVEKAAAVMVMYRIIPSHLSSKKRRGAPLLANKEAAK
ncbi:MAG: hypothetical protein GX572_04785 [Clostridia bacterium]|nr:hypothetical protein [Clostridia bacterium]